MTKNYKRFKKNSNATALLSYCVLAVAFLAQPVLSEVIQIGSYADLRKIGSDPAFPFDGSYELTADIDASLSRESGGVFSKPIGQSTDKPFTGIFDGKGHSIVGLYMNPTATVDLINVGLFGVTDGATIRNLTVAADTIRGNSYVGVLVGRAENSVITNCKVSGVVIGSLGYVGGMAGSARNTEISGCVSEGHVVIANSGGASGALLNRVGGLVGSLTGRWVTESASSCSLSVKVSNMIGVGGVVGYSDEGAVIKSNFSGYIDANLNTSGGAFDVGGIVGYNNGGRIDKVNVSGNLFGGSRMGGVAGTNTGTVINAYYSKAGKGGVTSARNHIGGLVGINRGGVVCSSYVRANVSGGRAVGGLVGLNIDSGVIEKSYYKSSSFRVNEFAPQLVSQLTTTDTVSGVDSLGGLVGVNRKGVVRLCFADSALVKGTSNIVGGLIGYSDSLVAESYFNGYAVTAGLSAGGLIGVIGNGGIVKQSYADGYVEGSNNVGGLAGGILTGGSVTECYSASRVVATVDDDPEFVQVGGLVGNNNGSNNVTKSYWDVRTSKQTKSAGGSGTETIIFYYQQNYADWDFTDVWVWGGTGSAVWPWKDIEAVDNAAYPRLRFFASGFEVSVKQGGSRTVSAKRSASVPSVSIRGKVMTVSAPSGTAHQIRVIDMRGKVAARFNANGGGKFDLGKIPSGRYLIEARHNGKRVSVSSHNVKF